MRPHGAGDLGVLGVGSLSRHTGRRRRIGHVVHRHDHAELERLGCRRCDDLDRCRPSEEPRHFVDRADRGREADALRGGRRAVRASQGVETLQAHGQVRAALGRRDRVHLVDDHGVHVAERLARAAREHQVQRLRCRDEDVGRVGDELAPIARRGVARTHADRHGGCGHAEAASGLADADQGGAEVALHVDAQRLQRRDVEDAGARGILLRLRRGIRALPEHAVDGPEERRQRLAGAGRGHHERVLARGDRIPRSGLRGGGRGEGAPEPVLCGRGEAVEHVAHPSIFADPADIRAVTMSAGRSMLGRWRTPGRCEAAARDDSRGCDAHPASCSAPSPSISSVRSRSSRRRNASSWLTTSTAPR